MKGNSRQLFAFGAALFILVSACGAPQPAATALPPTTIPTQAPAPTQPPPTATPVPAQRAAIDEILQDATKARTFNGAALVAQDGQIILSQGYGMADRSKKTPNTAQTKFRLGEMTMPFTAMAILILQEQGKLSVQDKLCTYLKDCPANWTAVTLDQLLTHSSGIPDTEPFNQLPDQALASIGKLTLASTPGSQFTYSHTGYIALGKVIEAVSGQTYEAFLQQNIFDPLKMTSTGYDHGQADLAIGYTGMGDQAATLPDPQAMFASGALYSTVEDLNRWDQALYTNQLVSAETLETMFTPHIITSFAPWTSSYGFIILPSGPHVVETSAFLRWACGAYDRYPDQKVVVILLANQMTRTLYDLSGEISHVMIGDW